jgi:hypothetical protein
MYREIPQRRIALLTSLKKRRSTPPILYEI